MRVQTSDGGTPDTIRPDEARQLRSALDGLDACQGGVIELVGDPGSGKSRLLAYMIDDAHRRGNAVAHIRCDEFEQHVPFRSFALLLSTAPMNDLLELLSAEERALINDVIMSARTPAADSAPSNSDHYRVAWAMHSLAQVAASSKMTVIFEDSHWADDESVQLLDHLVRRPISGPLLLVIAHRPRQASPRLRSALAHGVELGRVTRIELPPLSPQQSAHLLGMALDDPRLGRLHRAAEGNVLYLKALTHDTEWQENGLSTISLPKRIPAQVTGLLLGEVTALSHREFIVAAAAAVLGDQCDAAALAAVAELGNAELMRIVDSLLNRDILREVEHKAVLAFRHIVVRSVVYDHADPAWRISAHRRALNFLRNKGVQWSVLAGHLERSLAYTEASDATIMIQAAEEDVTANPCRAAHWLQLTLDAFPKESLGETARIHAQLLLARALGLGGALARSRELLHQVMERLPADDYAHRASTAAFRAKVECFLGNSADAKALLADEVAGVLAIPDPPPEVATLLIEQGMTAAFEGREASLEQVRLALQLARRHADRVSEAGAIVLGALLETLNGGPGARSSLIFATEFIDRLSDTELARHLGYVGALGWAELLIGLFQDAERHFSRALAIARRYGQKFLIPAFMVGLGNVYMRTGHLADARRLAREAQERAEGMKGEHLQGMALALESTTLCWGEPEDTEAAIELAERAMSTMASRGQYWNGIPAIALAEAAYLAGDFQRSVRVLLEVGGGDDLPLILPFLRPQCFSIIQLALLAAGEDAGGWDARATAAADGLDMPSGLAHARLARGLALQTRGEFDEAAAHILQAVELFSAARMTHAKAWALTIAARCFTESGDSNRALPLLTHAKELARRCGGTKLLKKAEHQERIAAKVAGRSLPAPPTNKETGFALLTEREREIAVIAGTGKRTREIAAELSLSPRTVDVHLTRIYRKLNISSRAMLARLVTESG